VFAHIVMAALNEVAMMIALASDPAAAVKDAESGVDAFLDRLLGGLGSARSGDAPSGGSPNSAGA
jgi:hypothetical protein